MNSSVASIPSPPSLAARLPFYYGWINVLVAALAMVGTLPGRTQGLGLITEDLLKDFNLGRTDFAQLNLWATLIGSAACVGFGKLLDAWGSRRVVTFLAVALGVSGWLMTGVTGWVGLAVAITLSRLLGQSALSVASLSVVPQWFDRRLPAAMATYSITLSVGFMLAFPLVGSVVSRWGWRAAWQGVAAALVLGLAPLALVLLRRSPANCGILSLNEFRAAANATGEVLQPSATLPQALGSRAFWVFAMGSTLYGLVASGIGLFNQSILAERGLDVSAYHLALAVTALMGLAGNFLGGWLAQRWPLERLLALAMTLLAAGLGVLPHLHNQAELLGQAAVMGIAGGLVSVLFFTVWTQHYGRKNVGQIQGAAQMLTVLGSAVGPLLLARVVQVSGSYAAAFYGLAMVVAALGWVAWFTPPPRFTSPTD